MSRGDVVQVNWPFSDLSGTKIRPAVVVQAEFLDALVDDTILVKITGSYFGFPDTEIELDPAAEPLSGLAKKCFASCKDLLTRDRVLVGPVIGTLSAEVMQRIVEGLKAVLQIGG